MDKYNQIKTGNRRSTFCQNYLTNGMGNILKHLYVLSYLQTIYCFLPILLSKLLTGLVDNGVSLCGVSASSRNRLVSSLSCSFINYSFLAQCRTHTISVVTEDRARSNSPWAYQNTKPLCFGLIRLVPRLQPTWKQTGVLLWLIYLYYLKHGNMLKIKTAITYLIVIWNNLEIDRGYICIASVAHWLSPFAHQNLVHSFIQPISSGYVWNPLCQLFYCSYNYWHIYRFLPRVLDDGNGPSLSKPVILYDGSEVDLMETIEREFSWPHRRD